MGLADTVTKAYMKENTVFADAFNYLIYGGKAVVNPAQLQELDTTEIALPFGAQNENRTQPDDAVQKYRDVLKSAVIKQDGEAAYILLGIENQTDIHYAMPVRNIIYDALQYGKQVADIAAKHRTDGSKGHTGEAFHCGTVESEPFLERSFQFSRCDSHGLQRSQHIREPQTNEAHVAFFDCAQSKLLLFIHSAPSFHAHVTKVVNTRRI